MPKVCDVKKKERHCKDSQTIAEYSWIVPVIALVFGVASIILGFFVISSIILGIIGIIVIVIGAPFLIFIVNEMQDE